MATVKNGECKAFARAAIEVCGITDTDQAAIDDYIESGVAACRWQRPDPRTPSCADLRADIDQLRNVHAVAPPPPLKKPSLLERAKAKFRKKTS